MVEDFEMRSEDGVEDRNKGGPKDKRHPNQKPQQREFLDVVNSVYDGKFCEIAAILEDVGSPNELEQVYAEMAETMTPIKTAMRIEREKCFGDSERLDDRQNQLLISLPAAASFTQKVEQLYCTKSGILEQQ